MSSPAPLTAYTSARSSRNYWKNGQLSPCLCSAPATTRRVIPYSSLIALLSPTLYFEGVISPLDIHWTSKKTPGQFIFVCFVLCMEIACFFLKERVGDVFSACFISLCVKVLTCKWQRRVGGNLEVLRIDVICMGVCQGNGVFRET